MGMFDWLTGTRAPDATIAAVPPDTLLHALLALNSDGLPWRVVDTRGTPTGTAAHWIEALGLATPPDLFAEWKFDDDRWQRQLADDTMSPQFRILMRLDPDARMVRSVDHDGSTKIRSDGLGFEVSVGRGQQVSTGFSMSFDRNADGKWVKTADSANSTDDIKRPLREVVERSGWGWKGVTFGRF